MVVVWVLVWVEAGQILAAATIDLGDVSVAKLSLLDAGIAADDWFRLIPGITEGVSSSDGVTNGVPPRLLLLRSPPFDRTRAESDGEGEGPDSRSLGARHYG